MLPFSGALTLPVCYPSWPVKEKVASMFASHVERFQWVRKVTLYGPTLEQNLEIVGIEMHHGPQRSEHLSGSLQ